MKEYIEREAAKMAVVEAIGKGHSPFNAIVMLPAADVVPVRHGNEEQALKKLAAYEEEEEQGLLVRLPCKVGDMVYALWSVPTPTKYVTYLAEVKEIRIAKRATRTMLSVLIEPVEFRGRRKEYFADDFGKLVFRTEEEAEAALKGEREDV